jgi:hypothetical protein
LLRVRPLLAMIPARQLARGLRELAPQLFDDEWVREHLPAVDNANEELGPVTIDENIEEFGAVFMRALMEGCNAADVEVMPFVAFVFPVEGFDKEVYEHCYRKAEETKELFPEEHQPFVVGLSPAQLGLEEDGAET